MQWDIWAIINPVDKDNVGIFGYSMCGSISMEILAAKNYKFNAVCLLAPATDKEHLKNLFDGINNWKLSKRTAQESKNHFDIRGRT